MMEGDRRRPPSPESTYRSILGKRHLLEEVTELHLEMQNLTALRSCQEECVRQIERRKKDALLTAVMEKMKDAYGARQKAEIYVYALDSVEEESWKIRSALLYDSDRMLVRVRQRMEILSKECVKAGLSPPNVSSVLERADLVAQMKPNLLCLLVDFIASRAILEETEQRVKSETQEAFKKHVVRLLNDDVKKLKRTQSEFDSKKLRELASQEALRREFFAEVEKIQEQRWQQKVGSQKRRDGEEDEEEEAIGNTEGTGELEEEEDVGEHFEEQVSESVSKHLQIASRDLSRTSTSKPLAMDDLEPQDPISPHARPRRPPLLHASTASPSTMTAERLAFSDDTGTRSPSRRGPSNLRSSLRRTINRSRRLTTKE